MIPTLSDEQRLAILASEGAPVSVRDNQTHAMYVIVDVETHRWAMEALRRQGDVEAIRRGIQDMESGRVLTLEEMDERMNKEFGFPPRAT